MTREEFSIILAERRKQKNIKIYEVCYKMSCFELAVHRIENGESSFRMDRCLKYLEAIGMSMQLIKRNTLITIKNYQDVKDILLSDKYITESRRATSLKLGLSISAFDCYYNQGTVMSIDVFLRLVDYLGFTLKIVPND